MKERTEEDVLDFLHRQQNRTGKEKSASKVGLSLVVGARVVVFGVSCLV